MSKAIGNTTLNNKGNSPIIYDLEEARLLFSNLKAEFSKDNDKRLSTALEESDTYYTSRAGYFELVNVIKGKASLGPTMRAINALKNLSTPAAISKRIARQGLCKTLSVAPLALVSCLTPAEGTPVETIVFSGIIVAIIVTVAAFWWADYKAGHFNRHHR